MLKILLADDENSLRRLVGNFLRKEQYEIIEAKDGQEALEKFYENPDIAACVLDVMMPKLDGYEVCKTIRQESSVPIIMLTAKTEEDDQIKGFNAGVDDYVSKPFSLTILSLRIKNLLKNTQPAQDKDIITYQNLSINTSSHNVIVDGESIELTAKEYELLLYLLKNQNVVLTREQIIRAIWNYDYFGDERTVDTHIKNLRIKLKNAGQWIKTIRGYGYKVE